MKLITEIQSCLDSDYWCVLKKDKNIYRWICVWIKYRIMMPCISKSVASKAFHSFSYYLVLIFLLNNLQCSTSALSTTVVPSMLSSNFTSTHEPVCSNVKDIFSQRGITEKDLPAKLPIKGEKRQVQVKWSEVSLSRLFNVKSSS